MLTIRNIALMLIAVTTILISMQSVAATEREAKAEAYRERLAPYGNWTRHPQYGEVWTPTAVSLGWRPYPRSLGDDRG